MLDPMLLAKAQSEDRGGCKPGDVYKLTLTVKAKDGGLFDVVDSERLIPDASASQAPEGDDHPEPDEDDQGGPSDEDADNADEERILGYKRPTPKARPFPKVNPTDLQR